MGGVCFFQGSPARQLELTNDYQAKSAVPLLIGIDGEWGLGMRFPESVMRYPRQLTLGAINDDNLIYDMGQQIAGQCKKLGIHMTFAPVIDLNNNARNPVINERSFGENKELVTAKAIAYMRGLQDGGLLATAKHFPGHGDTETDSHRGLPIIVQQVAHIHNAELFPFKALINEGVASVMVGHLHVPSFDDRPNSTATTSCKLVTDLLRHELEFDGLIVTDAMEMSAVSDQYEIGTAEAEAFFAGNDLILLPKDLVAAVDTIKSYLHFGKIPISQLDESVRRILTAKYRCAAFNKQVPAGKNILSHLNTLDAVALKTRMVEAAITLAKDRHDYLPLQPASGKNILCLSIGKGSKTSFQDMLGNFGHSTHFQIRAYLPARDKARILQSATQFDYVVIGLHNMSRKPSRNFGVSADIVDFVRQLSLTSKTVLCVFGNPYALRFFEDMPCLVVGYEDDAVFQEVTAQLLFGVGDFSGKLPVSASVNFTRGSGIQRSGFNTLGYAIPERCGLSSPALFRIDSLANDLIKKNAAPGCVILVAKNNRIVYHKAFGNPVYHSDSLLMKDAVFDLASVTKVLATTLASMKLYDFHKLDLDAHLLRYLPETQGTNKKDLLVADVLAHRAGLIPFIPFYQSTLLKKSKTGAPGSKSFYRQEFSPEFSIPVAQKLFLRRDYKDTLWQKVLGSPLKQNNIYRYSDLGFFLMKQVVENISGKNMDIFLLDSFYLPMGLKKTMFNPLQKIPLHKIVPSESDTYWRMQLVQGTVHDMGAAMLGGVGGHAGLFSTAYELGVLMQMLLNKGQYGGHRYLSKETVTAFTKRHPMGTRRGLGFDMKELDTQKSRNMSPLASDDTFGHTGFTGTCVYADPTNDLIYIFLSNRTYPSMNKNLLQKYDYRNKIQTCIYKALTGVPIQ
ncbi:MAG: serine hydrolase [Saprospiraceae bacterium]|nr:serine hydrolase [Saprospiraceae bacterium]